MPRMKAIIAYDGTAFSGYQFQLKARTVQGELETVLKKMHKGQFTRVHASGRTDKKVHAIGQTIHFDTPLEIEERNWIEAFRTQLPDDITVCEVKQVDADFHARYHAKKKEYRYRIYTGKHPDVFRRNYTYHISSTLDIDAMKKALPAIIGTHDFTSFCSAKTNVENKVRTIYEAHLYEDMDELVFCFIGNGFLYNMVRILVGTFLEIGRGKRSPDAIYDILDIHSRTKAGKKAPAHGLVLWAVTYD